jgi:hypothetical protein
MANLDPKLLKEFNQVFPQFIKKFNMLVPTSDQTIVEKINHIIESLNDVGNLTNNVVKNWNTVMYWVLNDGLTQNVTDKIDTMFTNGTFNTIIDSYSTQITNEFSTQLQSTNDGIQTATQTAQTQIDLINQNQVAKQTDLDAVTTQLAQNTQQLTDIVVTARKIGLIANDSSKATQNATILNQYLSTTQNTEITFLGNIYYFDNTIIVTGTNLVKGKKGTVFSFTNNTDGVYLKPFGAFPQALISAPQFLPFSLFA